MSAVDTSIVFVHGANQGDRTEEQNRDAWSQAFEAEADNHRMIQAVLDGSANPEIAEYHERKHSGCHFPRYSGLEFAWYGDLYKTHQENFSVSLNASREEDEDDRQSIIDLVERKVMKKHFDELVPFYELRTVSGVEKTLYEMICDRLIDTIVRATNNGEKGRGDDYVSIAGGLSDEYRAKVQRLSGTTVFGLLTFGNYTGYNWCQRLNNRLLYGAARKQFVYPETCARWRNYWTKHNSDPYIIDDMPENSMVDDDEDRFDDVGVWTIPFNNIGHGRVNWFARDNFVKKVTKHLKWHLYL